MKPGDWMCASCGDHQFARNAECRKCGAANPGGGKGGKGGGKGQKPGDWFCPSCNDLQFAKNDQCRKCGEPNPDPDGSKSARESAIAGRDSGDNMKPGDWFCPNCNDLNFARNAECRKCQAPNPDPEGSMEAAQQSGARMNPQNQHKPGDWTCSSCGDHQFARNDSCRKCGAPNPLGGGKGGGKGGKGGMGKMMGSMGGMGGCNNMGGCGGGGMVMIPQEMFAMMMGGGCGGGGCNMMSMMGGMMGGKGGGKCGKGGGKGWSPY